MSIRLMGNHFLGCPILLFVSEKYRFVCKFHDCRDRNHDVPNGSQMASVLFNRFIVSHGISLGLEINYFQTQIILLLLFLKTILDVQKLLN